MNKYTVGAIVLVVIFALGYATAKYLSPPTVITKTEEVVKEVERIKRDVVVVERIITNPDGTTVVDRTTTDKTTETSNKNSSSKNETIVNNTKPQWKVNALAGTSMDNISAFTYGAAVERRIVGPIFAGVWGKTDKQVGISVGLEF